MNETQRSTYLSTCELADGTRPLAECVADRVAPVAPLMIPRTLSSAPEAAVVGGSLVAFADSVSRQNKEDVMDSLLFATLVANKAANPETESDRWYQQFNTVLATLGWFSSNWRYARYQASQRRFTMDEVGLEIIKAALAAAALPGPASLAMLKIAKDALTALSAKDGPLGLFERQTKTSHGGNFRIASCYQNADGDISLAMGAVAFRSQLSITNVLFWEWSSADVETYRGENNLTLNSRAYANHRALVQERLGNNLKTAIAEFAI